MMKGWGALGWLVLCGAVAAQAQGPEITGFDRNGTLTFTSTANNQAFTLQFAPTAAGPWTNFGALSGQAMTGQVVSAPSPMYYRIALAPSDPPIDPPLRAYLVSHGYDLDGDYRLSLGELDRVTTFEFPTDLRTPSLRLEYFPNLEVFSIPPILENCALTNLVIANLPVLETVTCEALPVGSLIVTNLPSLRSLTFNGGPLSTLVLRDLPALEELLIRAPGVDMGGVLQQLAASGGTALKTLSCSGGYTNLNLSGFPQLQTLYCGLNNLTVLDISANTNLTLVNAQNDYWNMPGPPPMPLDEIIVWWNTGFPPPINLTYDGSPVIHNP